MLGRNVHTAQRTFTRREALEGMGACAMLLTLSGCGTGALAEAASAESSSASSSAGGTIRIGFPSSGQSFDAATPLGVAAGKGHFAAYLDPLGYTVEATGFVGAAPALHEALISGDLDLVDYAGFAGILGKSKGIDTTAIAVTQWGSGWSLAAAPDIATIADLKGKKVAYQRGATPQMFLIKVLAEGGLTFDDVEAVNATGPDGLSSLSTGAVAATVCSSGQEESLVSQGLAKTLFRGKEGDPSTYFEPFTLVARTEWLKKNGDAAVAVLKGYLAAKAEMVAGPDAFIAYAAEQSGQTEEVLRSWQDFENFGANYPLSFDGTYLDALSSIQDFEVANDLISGKIDIASWTDSSYLERAAQEYGNGD
ncbi:MAG: ABC transporter substrate-binding protein [Atopobiaceae bacterium]